MKKIFTAASVAVLSLAVVFSLQSCLKDSCKSTYKIYFPIYKKLTDVRADMKSQAPTPLEKTGKIYVYGNYIFLNEVQKGIHVIDNSNPSSPKNISFINIPGNVDIAVKGNTLYADCFSDIAVFDISNPANVVAKKFMNNVIRENGSFWGNRTDPDSVNILVGYQEKDTVVECDTYNSWYNCTNCVRYTTGGVMFLASSPSAASAPATPGVGGSMARFTIVDDYLYAVSSFKLYSIDITATENPVLANTKQMSGGIETIYPFKDKLFIGSVSGMFIYDLSSPSDPALQGQFSHVRSCDPVITDGQKAYVTLRSGNTCQGFTNQLEVLDVTTLSNPTLLKTYPMTNPHGLSKDDNLLFICDGSDGLKIYDASLASFKMVKSFSNFETYDVIALNGLAIVVAKDGLYQYDYRNQSDIKLLSRTSIKN
jgi:hypothetical protein